MPQTRRSSWINWLLILLVLGGAIAGGIAYWKRSKDTPVDFKTATIPRGDLTQAVTANGQLSPVINVQVGSQISGIINAIKVDFNSKVKQGDVIAQIDPATYESSVTQAEADLLSAKAALELTQINNRRALELRKSDLIAASEADKTVADLHQAEATVKMREAALQKAKVDLARTTIYAPINGVVISRNIDVGQTVAASFSTPTLFLIANDLAKMQIEAMVSEADVGGVEVGQRVNFTVDAYPAKQFHGEVTQVRYAPVTNQNVVTYTTVVGVNNDDLKLRPGMTANVSIITAQRRGVLKIPNAALRFRPPETAILKPPTNAPVAALASTHDSGASNALASADGSADPPSGPEEMRRRFEGMSPEQRAAWREKMRARSGEGGPPGFGSSGGGPRSKPQDGPATRTVYLLVKSKSAGGKEQQMARPVTVKTGITDGSYTEALDGLQENDVVITGVNLPATATAGLTPPGGSSPFGGPPGGGFRPR